MMATTELGQDMMMFLSLQLLSLSQNLLYSTMKKLTLKVLGH